MKPKNVLVRILVVFSRFALGPTFIFSGLVKAIDPHGFQYKIQDYLVSLNVPEFYPLALPVAIFLSVAEFVMGGYILLGIYRKWTSRFVLLFMTVMTIFTIWIALKNPVKDCVCFGDAIILSNLVTLYKNIVLLACAIILVIYRKKIACFLSPKMSWIAALFVVLFGFGFAIYNITNLPILDFRPYKIGSFIPKKMHVDPSKTDIFENYFIYEKDGKRKQFNEKNYPWNDSTWTFVEMNTKLVEEGKKPEIEDFSVIRLSKDTIRGFYAESNDITDSVLTATSYLFLMPVYRITDITESNVRPFVDVARFADENDYHFYCITSSSLAAISNWEKEHETGFTFCHSDERVLKTIIRSSPGLVLLKNGTIAGKWSKNSMPSVSDMKDYLDNEAERKIKGGEEGNNLYTIAVIILLFTVPLGVMKWIDSKRSKQVVLH